MIVDVNVRRLIADDKGVCVWVVNLPPGVQMTGPLTGQLRQWWDRVWRSAGRTPPPGLFILPDGFELTCLTGGQLADLGQFHIQGDAS